MTLVNRNFRKEESKKWLFVAPIYRQWRDDLGVDDCRKKLKKKEDPSDP